MTYKRYLLSVLLLGMTTNVFCNDPEETIKQVEEVTEEQVENQIVKLRREKTKLEQTLLKMKFTFQRIEEGRQFAIDNAGPKIKKEAVSWIEEIGNIESNYPFEEFIREVLDIISGKSFQILDEEIEESKVSYRKMLRDGVRIIEVLSRKFGTCLDDPENSLVDCLKPLAFVAVQLDRDIQLVDCIQKGVRSIFDLQEETLKKKLTRLEELKRHIQGKQQSEQEENNPNRKKK